MRPESTADTGATTREFMSLDRGDDPNNISGSSSTTRPSRRTPRTHAAGQGDLEGGALQGIKVDAGIKPLPFSPGEVITEG